MKSVLKESQVSCRSHIYRIQLRVYTKLLPKVVLATCHSSGSRQLFNEEFDVVIIDEATQALEAVSYLISFSGMLRFLLLLLSVYRFVGFPFSKPRN